MKHTQILIFSFLVTIMLSVFVFPAAISAEPNVADWLQDDQVEKQETPAPNEPVAAQEEQSLFGIIIKLVFYTFLILIMIYGLIKFLAIRQRKFQPNQAVQLMGGTPLGNNKSLQLVKVGEQVLLIGVGDQVTLIKEFANADEIGINPSDEEKPFTGLANPLLKLPQRKKGAEESRYDKTSRFEDLFTESLNKQKYNQQQFKQIFSNKPDDKEGNL